MKTHKILYVFSALAFLFGFSACSSDDAANDIQPVGNKVIVKAGIGESSIFTRANPLGKPEEQANFNSGDVINISDGNESINYTTTDGKTWNSTTPGKYLTWHSSPVIFKAYYPVANIKVNNNTYDNTFDVGHVMNDQRTIENIKASDFMTVTDTIAKEPTDHTLALTFQRQTARIIVNIVNLKNELDDVKDKRLQMGIVGNTNSNASELDGIYPYESEENKQYIALTFPTEGNPNFPFFVFGFLNDNGEQIPAGKQGYLTYTGIPKLEAGKSYTFNISLGKDKVTIESMNVEKWDTGADITGGEATLE